MPHNQSLTDPHRTVWLPRSPTQAKGHGVVQSKDSEARHIHMLPLLSRLSSVLVICQRKEILKAISILTSLVLPRATLQTSACALLYFRRREKEREKSNNPPLNNISFGCNIKTSLADASCGSMTENRVIHNYRWEILKEAIKMGDIS